MKNNYYLSLLFILLGFASSAQTQFWNDDFEGASPSGGVRTPSITGFNCSNTAYFNNLGTANISTGTVYTGFGGSKFWAMEDVDKGPTCANNSVTAHENVTWTSINIAGKTGLSFTGKFAVGTITAFDGFGMAQSGGTSVFDYLIIQYRIDGGAWTDIIRFFPSINNAGNGTLAIETTGDSIAQGEGTGLTPVCQTLGGNIVGTGTTLELKAKVFCNSAAEEILLDDFTLFETLPSPEINIQGNSVSIVDGDVTPSVTDHTDFGNQSVCSGTIVRTFTVQNTGSLNLTLSTPVISGANAGDFSISANPSSPVSASGSTTFQVTFNPSGSGTRSATLTITNNDSNEGTYDFAIQGTGVDPEVNVQGNSNSIADGDVTPSATDDTDFGSQSICSGTIVRTFTIQNTGNSNLTLANPTLSGTNAGDFSVTANPSTPVSAAGSTTFQVTFDPSASGVLTATVTFTTNDCDEATYDFAIQGTGTDPEVNLQGNSNTIVDGDVTPSVTDDTDFGSQSICSGTIVRTFTIQNTGSSNLTLANPIVSGTNAADFNITANPSTPVSAAGSTTFQVTFDPIASGTRTATVSFTTNDCDESTYDFVIQGIGTDPEVNVQGNSNTIADGDATPSVTDHTDFGSQSVCSGTVVRTFTIQNTGTSNLALATPLLTGVGVLDFTITTSPSTPVSAAGSTTFQVTFDPSASGTRSATVSFTSNDCDESIYDFVIQGTGIDPEVNVQGNSFNISDGDATPATADHTDFGSQTVCSGIIVRTFTIQNTGTSNLTLANPILSGTNAGDFSVTASPATPVSAAGSTTFQVTFDPSASGTRTATVSFTNNDCDESTYDFALQGIGTDPEVNVQGNSNTIVDGDVTPSVTDDTDFGSQSVCSGTIVRTFTIQNTGNLNLTLATPILTGTNAADFSITASPSTPVSAAGLTTFQVTFDPSASGIRTATVTFTNNDCDESTYDFAIQGTGIDPEVNVQGNSNSIVNGDATPSATDHTDFGSQDMCSGTIVRTFTIQNTGNSNLTLANPTLSGANAADFSVTVNPSTPVSAAGSTTFQVIFDPSASGTRTATVSFTSNDCDESTYDFAIQGTGIDGTPNADAPSNVTMCDSYTLPALTIGNYFTGSGGTGTALSAGNIISSTQLIYVYAVNGSCTDENSFTVTINTVTPTITTSLGNSRCDAGTLALSATPSSGVIKWYDASSAGTLLFTGSSYTTPSIGTTTTYYAEAVNGACVSAARTVVVATVGGCNTTLSLLNCGKTLTLIDDILGFTMIPDATNFEIWVEGPSGYSQTYVRNSNSNKFRMTFYTGIKYNTTYTVKIRAYVNGVWKTYGAPCNVTTPGFPVTKLQATDCGITIANITDKLTSDPIYAATNYEYWVQGPSSYSKTKVRGNASTNFLMSWMAGLAPNTTYTVKVRSYVEGAWTAYGSACNITTPSTVIMKYQDEIEMDMLSDFNMETYPNPNNGDFTIHTTHEGTFNIVNELGQLIQRVEITKENNFEAKVTDLTYGVYFITGTINNEVITKKVMVVR